MSSREVSVVSESSGGGGGGGGGGKGGKVCNFRSFGMIEDSRNAPPH